MTDMEKNVNKNILAKEETGWKDLGLNAAKNRLTAFWHFVKVKNKQYKVDKPNLPHKAY